MGKAKEEMSAAEMVRLILDEGKFEKPKDIFNAIKERFGVEVAMTSINNAKTQWKKAKGESASPKASAKKTDFPFGAKAPSHELNAESPLRTAIFHLVKAVGREQAEIFLEDCLSQLE